jgi:DNA-binding transcriptional regulator YhcF (GntR family)
MPIQLAPDDQRPVYLRIADAITAAAVRGELAAGDPLPPVRTLSQQLGVHPNTVLQAYGELARLRVVVSRRGRGTFLLHSAAGPAERRALTDQVAQRAMRDAHAHGVTVGELVAALERLEALATAP